MNKLFSVTSAVFFIAVSLANGQTKKLSIAQARGQEASLTKSIARYDRWADAEHYIERGNGEYKVNVKTGKKEKYDNSQAAVSTNVNAPYVVTIGKDLYFRINGEEDKQLTFTPEVSETLATLSPDNKYVAFLRKRDLYTVEVATGKEVRHTKDATDVIYNGYASWVYYEEILGRATNYKAYWWSPDSKKVAFMRFDDTKVPMFPIYNSSGQHGFLEETRYPKAGDPNPEVRVGIAHVDGSPVVWADFNEKDDQYFGEPYWSFNSSNIMVQWMNRDQTNLKFYQVDPNNGAKKEIYNEEQPTWINLDHPERITYLKDNKHYILKSDKTGWAHYYLYTLDGKLVNPLTSGDWQVTEIKKIDEKEKVLYFMARKENSATVDFYRVDFSGKNLKRLTFGDYTHSVNISPDSKYFITTYSNIHTPTKVALVDNKGKIIRELADSKSADFDSYKVARREFIRIPSDDGKFQLPAIITYPTDFDETKEYPVIMSIYGGPDAGTVRNTWKGIQNELWAQQGVIFIECDHRASGQFGKQGVAWMHRNLGNWELVDYITFVKYLKVKPYVAKNKLMITGHSYGGYMTCLALTKGADYFDYGIAGAPVTSWDLYDTHYTERWMDTPKDNPDGYKNGSVLTFADKYKGRLRIMHGDMDDNVHIQNTIQLVSALTSRSVPFELMIYPGSRHGFDRSKSAYDNKERTRFIYQYLLEKPVPDYMN